MNNESTSYSLFLTDALSDETGKRGSSRPRQQPLWGMMLTTARESTSPALVRMAGQLPVGSPWPGETPIAPSSHLTFCGRPRGPTGRGPLLATAGPPSWLLWAWRDARSSLLAPHVLREAAWSHGVWASPGLCSELTVCRVSVPQPPRPSPHTDPTWSVFLCES